MIDLTLKTCRTSANQFSAPPCPARLHRGAHRHPPIRCPRLHRSGGSGRRRTPHRSLAPGDERPEMWNSNHIFIKFIMIYRDFIGI